MKTEYETLSRELELYRTVDEPIYREYRIPSTVAIHDLNFSRKIKDFQDVIEWLLSVGYISKYEVHDDVVSFDKVIRIWR